MDKTNFRNWMLRGVCAAVLATSIAFAGGVATNAKAAETPAVDDVNDPIEPVNRFFFQVNEALQVWFIRPAATMYRAFLPPGVRRGVNNVLANLGEPVTLANELLQGEGARAQATVERFAINTTYGVGGLYDQATDMGRPRHKEDFGQTMAVWGAGEGFYLMLPLFGPSNPRDAVGKLVVDPFFDPLTYVASSDARLARTIVKGIDEYEGVMDELEQIKKTSIDYYAALRSMYRQKREAEIRNGESVKLPPIPDLSIDLERPAGAQPAVAPVRGKVGEEVSAAR